MKRILFGLIAALAGLFLAAPVSANNCLSFDGLDDFVDCTNDPSLQMTDNVTVEAWILTNSKNTNQGIASKLVHEGDREGYSLEIWESNKLSFTLGCSWNDWSCAQSSAPLSTGTWYHVAGTYDGSTIRVYVNGELQVSTAYTSGIMDSQTPLVIGSRYWDWFFNGKIDLVRVWNVARTQEQIQANKGLVVAPGTTGLVAQYTFDQGVAGGDNSAVTTLDDSSGVPSKSSPVDGTLRNFDLLGSSSNWVGSSAPAAVELSSFTASGKPGKVELAWSTASETNSANWLVERSTAADGGYSQIGRLPASGGSTSGARYSYTDDRAEAGVTYYYKIAEQEQNGAVTYYGPVQAMTGVTAPVRGTVISAWPNPFRASVRLQCAAQSQVQVYDLTGRLVRNLGTSTGEVEWDGHNDRGLRLGPGVYFVCATAPGGTVTRKVTKIQ